MRRRVGTHIRQNRISGDVSSLNQKAIKVLGAIKFNSSSITREEIMEKVGLPIEDVNRQVKLLLSLRLIQNNRMFPQFPNEGWRVYTNLDDHNKIIKILRDHNLWDEASNKTKEVLGGYYPTGMALEGLGVQPFNNRSYPESVLINEDLYYRPETIEMMKKFRDEIKPFRPKEYSLENIKEREKKWEWLAKQISTIYQYPTPKVLVGNITERSWVTDGSSSSSSYNRMNNVITINGKFSLITFLHEISHSRGFDEVDAILWSTNLFKRIFPVSFSRLAGEDGSHVLVLGNREESFNL